MNASDFNYNLPLELIAQHPIGRRDQSRLLCLSRKTGAIHHYVFEELLQMLHPGDCLVVNDSRVLPARLIGQKDTGARVEVLLLTQVTDRLDCWEALAKPGRKAKPGSTIWCGSDGELKIYVEEIIEDGKRIIRLDCQGELFSVIERYGVTPLPPYIYERLEEPERYQTVYSKHLGSVAAPTAGLHFTPQLLKKVEEKGVSIAKVTLHVGLGTFRPMKTERIDSHIMHSEFFQIDSQAAEQINCAKRSGGRVIAVGTTSCRALETVADSNGFVRPASENTNIFIYPGYRFKCIDALITNFHLPKSTLLMLVSAFAGKDITLQAYQIAIKQKYRFFSFGDAMFITD